MREPDRHLTVATPDGMRALGARIARAIVGAGLQEPLMVGLCGDLGAGKTTLVGGLLAELGHDGPARSPTYSLVEPYRLAGRDLYHCDLYRLRDPEELEDIGLRDLLQGDGVLLVEWPERAGNRLRAPDLRLSLAYEGDGRSVSFEASSDAGRRIIQVLGLDAD